MEPNSITVIITVWKRGYLEQQLTSLTGQTVRPSQIWIIQNEHHIRIREVVEKFTPDFPAISIIHSDYNFKFFGRFSLVCHVQTEYVLVIDDDVIPAASWLERCLRKSKQYNAVISCTGRIIKPASFRPEEGQGEEKKLYFIGDNQSNDDNNFIPDDTRVDYGCNSYFFRTEWIKHFWSVWPATFLSGEDIHLSASLMIARSIPTIVPRQLCRQTSGNLHKLYSQDEVSSWRNTDFIDIRQSVFEYLIKEKNWKPILWQ